MVGDYFQRFAGGDLFVVGPMLPHSFAPPPEAPSKGWGLFYVLTVDLKALSAVIPPGRKFSSFRRRMARGLRFGPRVSGEILPLMQRAERASGPRAAGAILEILATLAEAPRGRNLSRSASVKPLRSRDVNRMDRVLTYLRANHDQEVRLPAVADAAGLSEVTLSRLFRRATGKTVVEHLNELRTAHACRLLKETDATITEIAFRVGYNTLSNFNRMFRRIHKTTPTGFRTAER